MSSSSMEEKKRLLQEKRQKIEDLKKKQLQNQPIGTVIQTEQINQDQVNLNSSQIQQQEPVQNQNVIAPPQQSDFLSLYLQTKRKKLGFQTIEMYSNNPAPPQAEVITIEFGVQCELEVQQEKQENEDQVIPLMENVRRDSRKQREVQQSAEKQVEKVEKNISHEEINSIIQSQSFQRFFSRSSKTVEKAIHGGEVDVLEDLMNIQQIQQEIGRDNLTKLLSFSDKLYTDNRVVTSIQWSPTLPNTFLAAYSQNEEGSIADQVGVVLLWSLQLKSRPEFYCFASSPITSACFHPFSPNVVLQIKVENMNSFNSKFNFQIHFIVVYLLIQQFKCQLDTLIISKQIQIQQSSKPFLSKQNYCRTQKLLLISYYNFKISSFLLIRFIFILDIPTCNPKLIKYSQK